MRLFSMAVVGAAVLVLGCGDDDKEQETGPKGTGIMADKQLASLSRTEVYKLCELERDSFKASVPTEKQYCFRFEVESLRTCQSDLDACLASDWYEDELSDDWDCQNLALKDYLTPNGACSATIAQFEACEKERSKLLRDHYAQSRCDRDGTLQPPTRDAEACKTLALSCPALINR